MRINSDICLNVRYLLYFCETIQTKETPTLYTDTNHLGVMKKLDLF